MDRLSSATMAGIQPSLEGSLLPLVELRSQAQRTLISLLDRRPGRKCLVLDPKISGPLALVANIGVLKEHGVEKLFHLEKGLKVGETLQEIVYLVRPTIANMRLISEQIIEAEEKGSSKRETLPFSVYFTPRKTVLCERILEDCGVLGSIQIDEFPLWLIPFDEDVLSLEIDSVFNEVNVEKDFSSLYDVASAIVQLQKVCGLIPRVRGKGKSSKIVANLMQRLALENDLLSSGGKPKSSVASGSSQIDTVILLDRSVDLLSPMCTQLTYEGLIDEILGINNGLVEVPVECKAQPLGAMADKKPPQPQQQGRRGKKYPLNSSDVLFRELRDLNFGSVGPKVRKSVRLDSIVRSLTEHKFSPRCSRN